MTNIIINLMTASFRRLVKSVYIVLTVPLIFSACSNDMSALANKNNTSEKSVNYISYLGPNQEANGILVKFNSNANSKSRARSLQAAGLVRSNGFNLVPGLTLAQTTPGLTINQTLANLSTDANVAYAEPDYIVYINVIPDDTDFLTQWGLNNSNDADIDAPEAWNISTGSNTIVIAVIDSGVDYNHPDLRNQIWSNVDEIANNGIDDDGNGFVDDIRGWDFSTAAGDNDPLDEHDHGTHVAGVIGAQANNARGVAGVNWNLKIMPLKFMNAQGAGSTSAAINAIDYAVANGALVSNNSWGGGGFSQALFDAIQAANRKNHLFIAAAGNDGVNTDNAAHYPSSYNLPNIISVAATDKSDRLTGFSNFGNQTVDLAAPGFQINSTVRNGLYQTFSGTSMAAPFVTGVAGLLLAQNNTLTVAELKAAILDNTDPIASLSGKVLTGGRLNAFKAITGIPSAAPVTPVTPVEITSPTITTLLVGQTLQFNAIGGDGNYTWASLNPNRAKIDTAGLMTALGNGAVRITATDGSGLVSPVTFISVNIPSAATLTLSPSNLLKMGLNAVTQISVSGGTTPYTWTNSNSTVAALTVTADTIRASISALSSGSFSVTATDANGISVRSASISIDAPALNLNAGKTTLRTQEKLQLTASGGTSPYAWSSSAPTLASVDAGGLVTGLNSGSSSISVTDITGASQAITMQIISAPTGNLNLTPNNPILALRAKSRLIATGGGVQFTWSSSDVTVAEIDSRGIVTTISEGITEISVIDENSMSGTTNVEVRAVNITAAVLTIAVGDTLQLTAIGGKAPYQWKVSNSAIATISNGGLLTANPNGGVGGILVSASDADNISKSIIVTVNNSTILREPRAF